MLSIASFSAQPGAGVDRRRGLRSRLRRAFAGIVVVPAVVSGLSLVAATPAVAAAVSLPASALQSGFPAWYEDNNGNRVEACLDANDANCVLPPAGTEPGYDPASPLSFPTNFPSEFFYSLATSDSVATPGCGASPPGRAFVTLATEGAFLGGAPRAGDQMTFGRVRFRVTSGLCAGQAYTFDYPFGSVTLTANAAGAVPVNGPGATSDVGCVPSVLVPCNFALATGSPVFGGPATGFVRWDGTAPAAPVGYLGDGVTPHPVTGATAGGVNAFTVTGPDSVGGVFTGTTNLFTVAGKVTGSASVTPSPVDFGGVTVNSTSPQRTITVTNLDKVAITFGGNAARIRTGNGFTVNSTTCRGTFTRDQTCSIVVSVRPATLGVVTDFVDLTYTGGIRGSAPPFEIPLVVAGTTTGAAPALTVAPLAFGSVRVRTSSTLTMAVTNSGTAPLLVSAVSTTGVDSEEFRVASTTCTGVSVAAGASCAVSVMYAPIVQGPKSAGILISSNAATTPDTVAVTGTGTGGVAAVSADRDPIDGFPTWYRDENAVKLTECVDPNDPYCVVLPDATFTRARPLNFLNGDPTQALNFPGEFFYTVADSDLISTPGCNGTAPGRSAYRSAIEGTFINGEPVDGEQMVFGRERIYVTTGLCPNTPYTFTTPYGQTTLTTNPQGGIGRARGSIDIGCAPIAPALCDFSEALSSPVLGGVLRWDPSIAPTAPAGYIGDAAALHRVVGAPFKEDGINPSNYFKITGPGLPVAGLQTNQFSVMGKLRGPLEATGGLDAAGKVVTADTPVGGTSAATTLTLTNTGVAVGAATGNITITTATVGGADPTEFATANDTCSGATLVPGATCTVDVTFAPAATGVRAATLTLRHSGLNDPLVVPLEGTGQAATGVPAISFTPRSLAFGQYAVGRSSRVETVTISNAGGSADLTVLGVLAGGATPAAYSIVANSCTVVAIGASCTVDVVFSPVGAGPQNGSLVVTDDAPGGTHTVPLTGAGFGGAKAVSASLGMFGYPSYYQDSNGTRLEPCLDPTNCVLLGVPDPAAALAVPDNFPGEFFYALADTEQITVPGCAGGADGTAFLRVGLEGSFAGGAPVAGDQTTFTRIRLVASGLCPNVPNYQAVTPYGTFTFGTDANGTVRPNAGTQDTGCGAAPCAFADALQSPGAVLVNSATPIEGFLRWDPNVATPPAGYLGDATSFKKVVGGSYVKPGTQGAFNGFEIRDPADNLLSGTDNWLVAGKIAGPLAPNAFSLDFGNVDQGSQSATQTVVVTNVGAAPTGVAPSLGGADAAQFTVTGGTCGAGSSVTQDSTCTVVLRFAPSTAGTKAANLVLTPGTGRTSSVALTGVSNPVATPNITVTPGVLSYGTVTAPGAPTLTATVTNTGLGVLNVTGTAIAGGGGDYTVNGGTCPGASFTLASTASCTIGVQFKPSASGARTGTLTLTHNAAGGTTVISLTGTGAGASWSVSPSPVGFGTVIRGTTKTSTLSVKNTGTANGTITAAGTVTSGLPFGVVVNPATSTCFNGTAVAPGKTCSISVTFTPTAVQAYTGTLTIDGGTSSLPRLTTVTLTGAGK